ncbi:hypothetical protein PAE3394a [Pyrobaculum aerophilum str. IM2]|uniref:Uncharacterized protein n=1 Tax=Pyrobaculum aerophilum (strain ATCC 51768 / DSM 7523 / JCM 9630 / CIP 104966 / NBRC 100827 / IM2) TaxID=178306 RepID=Q8ZT78_PYRAE|nr:hypothetical protein [Pyrobaculum aerophilum]AAL64885.1 hypothetical protein PAE3394a [Pyrobaculum aerophilum str. IM2]
MEKFRTIVGEKKEEPKREVAEAVQEARTAEGASLQEITAVVAKEATDVGQFMRYVASTIAKLPPEERTFVRFLIAPKATPLVINDRMIDVIFKNHRLIRRAAYRGPEQVHVPRGFSKTRRAF